ncbi:hypothetical protein ACLEPN_15175 [Myxococcus sp. 1LA]
MSNASSKKPTLKKETLRALAAAELPQLDGAVGGNTPALGLGGGAVVIGTATVQPTSPPRTLGTR